EVESLLVGHPAVTEAAAVGVPDELKGESLVCFAILKPGQQPSTELEQELKDLVAHSLGKPLRPHSINFVADLPRTRNAKILRRGCHPGSAAERACGRSTRRHRRTDPRGGGLSLSRIWHVAWGPVRDHVPHGPRRRAHPAWISVARPRVVPHPRRLRDCPLQQ